MKRALKMLAAVLLLALAAVVVLFASMMMHAGKIQDGEPLGSFGTLVKDGFVDVGVIELGAGKLALIDAGNDPDGKALMKELARRKLGPDAVAAIFLTHGHRDHIAGVHLFPMAQVYALEAEVPLIEGKVAAKGPIPRFFGAHPTQIAVQHPLHDGEVINLGQRKFEVFAVPGHTAGSAAYLVDGILFLGDSADSSGEGTIQPAKWLVSDDVEVNHVALKSLAERLKPRASEVKLLVFSHSPSLVGLDPLIKYASGA